MHPSAAMTVLATAVSLGSSKAATCPSMMPTWAGLCLPASTTIAPAISVSNVSGTAFETLMMVKPVTPNVEAAHEGGAGRVGDMLDDLTQARGAVGVAGPAAMDADRQDPAAGLVGFAEHVIDGGAAII